MKKKVRVGIIFGGRSAEHEVSLQSARNIFEAIDKNKYEVFLIGIDKNGQWYLNAHSHFLLNHDNPKLIALNKTNKVVALVPDKQAGKLVHITDKQNTGTIDVVFPVLHGPFGEDRTIQGLLKLANIPFVGPDVLGSAVGMDKDVQKRLLKEAKIPIARFIVIDNVTPRPRFSQIKRQLGLPMFIKPANLGSSVGVSKVNTKREFEKALELAFEYDNKVLIEEYIKGREIECSVLGNEKPIASIPGEIKASHDFYTYEAKYIDENGAILEIPAKLQKKIIKKVQNLSVKTFKTLCLEGMARVDMFLKEDGQIIINEVNTIPGFTKISMYPKLWEISGVPYTELIDRLITLAIERFSRTKKLKTTV